MKVMPLRIDHHTSIKFIFLNEFPNNPKGKKLFVSEQLALKLYESLDQEFVDSLDQDYFEEFFDFLSTINELGRFLGQSNCLNQFVFILVVLSNNWFDFEEKSKDYLYQTEFLQIVLNTAEKHVNEEETMRHFGLFLVKLVVQGRFLVFN